MKPINRGDEGCIKSSSDCVRWEGDSLKCVGICNGDCLTEVVYTLAKQLCNVLSELNVTAYDLSCFNLQTCALQDFTQLIQLIIAKICALENIQNPTTNPTGGCPDNCTVSMASCFYYTDPNTGDQITTNTLTNYVTLIGNSFCELLAQQGITLAALQNQGGRLSNAERNIAVLQNAPPAIPSIVPVCVMPANPTRIDIVLQALEAQFCAVVSALGTPNELFQAIAKQPAGLNSSPSLGTPGISMAALPGWVSTVTDVSDSINNLWVAYGDMYAAIRNIQLNCCPTPCSGLSVLLQATLPNPNTLILFFTGAIPQGLLECNAAGTLITIADQSGNSISLVIPIFSNINNISGYPVILTNTPLNTSENFTITATICFKNNNTGTICQSDLAYTFVNTISCPNVTFIPGLTTLAFSFSHASGTKTYAVDLYDSTGNILMQSQVFPETNPTTVSGTFSGLVTGTTYKVRIIIQTPNTLTTICPFTVVTTLPSPCPHPLTVTAIITIP